MSSICVADLFTGSLFSKNKSSPEFLSTSAATIALEDFKAADPPDAPVTVSLF